MWLIQIDKNKYINALNVDAVTRGFDGETGRKTIRVAVSQNWFDVDPDYSEIVLNHLQAYNGNSCSNVHTGLTDKVN